MNVSKSTRYALYAAAEMARAGELPTTVGAVAARYRIPEGALAKVFQQMVRSGLAIGTRGIGGGYRLSRPASKITVLDVIRAFEAPRVQGACIIHDGAGQRCPVAGCEVQWLFHEVDELVQSTYESVTLQTLVRRSRKAYAPDADSTVAPVVIVRKRSKGIPTGR